MSKPAKRKHPEEDLQRAVAQLLDMLDWHWWHTPNGGRRSKIEAARFVGLGVKAGVSDVIIAEPWEVGEDRGGMIAIELKAPGGRLTKSQAEYLERCRARGWLTAVCRSVNEVLEVIACVNPTNGRRMRGAPQSIEIDPRQTVLFDD